MAGTRRERTGENHHPGGSYPVAGPLQRWFRSLRAYSFSASLLPVALAGALVLSGRGNVLWWALPLVALSAVLLHAGTNVLNDYYDFLHGVDVPGDPDPTHVITRGIVSPQFMRRSGYLYFALGILIGAIVSLVRGPLFFAAGLLGAVAALFYTNARFSLKYRALGELAVFVLMGPALTLMTFWALTGVVSLEPVAASLPVAFFVTTILLGNNLRNIPQDRSAGVTTLAGTIGFRGSKFLFVLLILLGYGAVALLSFLSVIGGRPLLGLLTLPLALSITQNVLRASAPEELLSLPIRCATLHLAFGTLYVLGVAFS